jgi:hypothetical protein
MTCTVVIKEGAAPAIGTGLKKVMTAILEHLRVSFKTARVLDVPERLLAIADEMIE